MRTFFLLPVFSTFVLGAAQVDPKVIINQAFQANWHKRPEPINEVFSLKNLDSQVHFLAEPFYHLWSRVYRNLVDNWKVHGISHVQTWQHIIVLLADVDFENFNGSAKSLAEAVTPRHFQRGELFKSEIYVVNRVRLFYGIPSLNNGSDERERMENDSGLRFKGLNHFRSFICHLVFMIPELKLRNLEIAANTTFTPKSSTKMTRKLNDLLILPGVLNDPEINDIISPQVVSDLYSHEKCQAAMRRRQENNSEKVRASPHDQKQRLLPKSGPIRRTNVHLERAEPYSTSHIKVFNIDDNNYVTSMTEVENLDSEQEYSNDE